MSPVLVKGRLQTVGSGCAFLNKEDILSTAVSMFLFNIEYF